MDIRKDIDGLRIKLPGDPTIYLMDEGKKRGIPNAATYNNLFRNWDGIVQDLDIDEIETGNPINDGAILIQFESDNKEESAAVYLLDGVQKRLIGSPNTMERYNFSWDTIQHYEKKDRPLLNAIPNGGNIVWPE